MAPLLTKLTWYIGSEHILVFEVLLGLCLVFVIDLWWMFRKWVRLTEAIYLRKIKEAEG